MAEIRWLPLESNPDVMNKYALNLGVSPEYQFFDVYGFDSELLRMIPRPVLAVMMLYPLTTQTESDPFGEEVQKSDVYFIKQTIGNACGTIGLIHALCNNAENLNLDKSKQLYKFLQNTKDKTPEERGQCLENDTGFGQAHEESAQEGQTSVPERNEKIDLHFIAFVQHDGVLYELDGRKSAPVSHGPTSPDSLLEDTVDVVRKFIAKEPDNPNFTVVAFAKAD